MCGNRGFGEDRAAGFRPGTLVSLKPPVVSLRFGMSELAKYSSKAASASRRPISQMATIDENESLGDSHI